MNRFKRLLAGLAAVMMLGMQGIASAQVINGNSFPYWDVRGPLTVSGLSTLSGGMTLTGTTSFTSPAITTSITTPSTSFSLVNTTATTLAIGGAATTVTLGAATGTVTVGPAIVGSIATDSTTSTTGAWKTAGGLGVAKAVNIGTTLGVTGVTTLSGGLKGTTTNDAATALNVGELLTTTVASGSAIAVGNTGVAANLTSVSLTAGDWDVSGTCDFLGSSLIATVLSCGLGTTTDTQASQAGGSGIGTDPLTIESFASQTLPNSVRAIIVPPTRVTLASTTTIYLVSKLTYSSGSATQYGTIRARRMR